MTIITIVGAGVMGSALTFPAADNRNEVRLVGTHLDEAIIQSPMARSSIELTPTEASSSP